MGKDIGNDEKIWRISSLTSYIDEDTKIVILPKPESKREVKPIDTKYSMKTYEDLFTVSEEKEKHNMERKAEKRYEDMTEEEMKQSIAKRRKQRFQQHNRLRLY